MEKLSQNARILALLKTKRRVTNRELNRICFRYGARIHELRNEGYIIITNRVHESLYEFVYMGHVEDKVPEFAD